mgnify:CR=1 FL=1
MNREFHPYASLWTTVSQWKTDNPKWLNGKWEELDAISADKFVEDGIKTLASAFKFFKEKELVNIYKIA